VAALVRDAGTVVIAIALAQATPPLCDSLAVAVHHHNTSNKLDRSLNQSNLHAILQDAGVGGNHICGHL
jgi:hypothetical protein